MNDRLAHVLRQLDLHSITRAALCQEAGIDQAQLSRWLKGTYKPREQTLKALESALTRLLYFRQG